MDIGQNKNSPEWANGTWQRPVIKINGESIKNIQ
jgi:hypothetical protein